VGIVILCWAWRYGACRDEDTIGGFDEVNIGCEISWGWDPMGRRQRWTPKSAPTTCTLSALLHFSTALIDRHRPSRFYSIALANMGILCILESGLTLQVFKQKLQSHGKKKAVWRICGSILSDKVQNQETVKISTASTVVHLSMLCIKIVPIGHCLIFPPRT
jgi:hypothetical protein